MKAYVAFFDLDGTILDISTFRIFVKAAMAHSYIGARLLAYGVWLFMLRRLGFLDTARVFALFTRRFAGFEEQAARQLARDMAGEMIGHIREGAIVAIGRHRQNGARTVILSGSLAYYCDIVREHLSMDDVLCTMMEVVGGRFTGNFSGVYCAGEEKLRRVRDYCAAHGFSPGDAWYYADSPADLPALGAVGHPVCVAPRAQLRLAALRRGWPVVRWDGHDEGVQGEQ